LFNDWGIAVDHKELRLLTEVEIVAPYLDFKNFTAACELAQKFNTKRKSREVLKAHIKFLLATNYMAQGNLEDAI
ncbi:hypothetical protein LTR49_028430, partial [Elasticomyces elasticus]